MSQLRSVWLVFNLFEAILAVICAGIHISGMLYEIEPLPHYMYFCGTYCTFFIISVLGVIGVYFGSRQKIMLEAFISATGCFFFLVTAIFSMYYAERDFHLMYLSDTEEAYHPFFMTSKAQSITSLICSVTYLLHFTFAVDALIITEDVGTSTTGKSYESINSNYCALKPIKTNLICWSYFYQFEFCQYCLKQIDYETDDDINESIIFDDQQQVISTNLLNNSKDIV